MIHLLLACHAGVPSQPQSTIDADLDGYDSTVDCDDEDANIHPGAQELCDGEDQDCDGTVDEGVQTTWYEDTDGDGYGDPETAIEACNPSGDQLAEGDDCDDGSPDVHPDAQEICEDGIDQDCDEADRSCTYGGTYELSQADVKLTSLHGGEDAGRRVDVGDLTGDGVNDLVVATLYARNYWGGAFIVPGPVASSGSLAELGHYLEGSVATSGAGRSVGIGDLNGDGLGDLLVGAPWAPTPSAWITFGPITANSAVEEADVQLTGPTGTYAAHGCDLGDVDGDGLVDVVVGAYAAHGGANGSGLAWVVHGPLTAGTRRALSESTDGLIWGTSNNGYFGRWVQAGADANGDGIGDVLISAPYDTLGAGAAYLFLGPLSARITTDEADGAWTGEQPGDYAAEGIGLGDIDGDGRTDLLVGATTSTPELPMNGTLYVVFGPGTGVRSLGEADVQIHGATLEQSIGLSAQGGDVDGDGRDELLVGANSMMGLPTEGGSAWLFYDLEPGTWTTADAAADFMAEQMDDFLGEGVALGDLDTDHRAEAILGAPGNDAGGPEAGAVYVQWP